MEEEGSNCDNMKEGWRRRRVGALAHELRYHLSLRLSLSLSLFSMYVTPSIHSIHLPKPLPHPFFSQRNQTTNTDFHMQSVIM